MYSQYTLGHRTAHNAGSASFVHAQRGEFSSTNTVLASGDQYFQYQDNPTLGNYIVQNPQQYYSFSQPYLNPYNITPHLNVPQHPPSMEDRITMIVGLIQSGQLVNASTLLREWTRWLIKNAADLGLFLQGLLHDNRSRLAEDRRLWQNLNFCWLALFQKQWDLTSGSVEWLYTTNLLTTKMIEEMGDEMVNLCDKLERPGLVDYELGLWENEIISIIMRCLDLMHV